MKIAVFGATGGTGRQIVKHALAAGHEIKVLVRDTSKLDISIKGLTIIQGSVLNQDKVAQTLFDTDAVICSLGSTANNPEMIVSKGTEVIVQTMQTGTRPRRLIVVSSLGVGDSKDQVPMFFKLLTKTVLRKPIQDKEAQEKLVRASGLDWIIIRPGGLTDNPATGHYKAGLDKNIIAGQVSRADVAAFTLQQLSDNTYLHKTPAIT